MRYLLRTQPPILEPAGLALFYPVAVAVGPDGRVVVVEQGRNSLLLWDRGAGRIQQLRDGHTDAGLAEGRDPWGSAPFEWAEINIPRGVVPDGTGDWFLCDAGYHTVVRLDMADREIHPLVRHFRFEDDSLPDRVRLESGFRGAYGGDGDSPRDARLGRPWALALYRGVLYVADRNNHAVRAIDLEADRIDTVLGDGSRGSGRPGQDEPRAFRLDEPCGVAAGPSGIYVADTGNHRILRLPLDGGPVERICGTGEPAATASDNDVGEGGPAIKARLAWPTALALAEDGTLYIADTGNHRMRAVSKDGAIRTVAGTGVQGFGGDDGPATQAKLNLPEGLGLGDGGLYIADTHNHRLRFLDLGTGLIRTVLGTGDPSPKPERAMQATLAVPQSRLAVDQEGNVYVGEYARINARVLRLDVRSGLVSIYAGGTLSEGNIAEGVDATLTGIFRCGSLAIGPDRALYLADIFNYRVRRVDPVTNLITTTAGGGPTPHGRGMYRLQNYEKDSGDGGPALQAAFGPIDDMAVGRDGTIFIVADGRLRAVDPKDKFVRLVAGPGASGPAGRLNDVSRVAVAPNGTVHVAAGGPQAAVWRLDGDGGLPRRVLGGGDGPYGLAGPEVRMSTGLADYNMAFDSRGNLLITCDLGPARSRLVLLHADTGLACTILGGGIGREKEGLDPFDWSPTEGDAQLEFGSVAVDAQDKVYVVVTGRIPTYASLEGVIRFPLTEDLIQRALARARAQADKWREEQEQGQGHGIPDPPVPPVAPAYDAFMNEAATAFREARYQDAEAAFGRALELQPEDPRGWIGRAMARQKLGDLPGALADLDRAVDLSERASGVLRLRGQVRRAAGDPAGAAEDWEAAIQADGALEAELRPLIKETRER